MKTSPDPGMEHLGFRCVNPGEIEVSAAGKCPIMYRHEKQLSPCQLWVFFYFDAPAMVVG
jgi:hypothetical protein